MRGKPAFQCFVAPAGRRGGVPISTTASVPKLAVWLKRRGAALPVPADPWEWRAGDIFTSRVGGRGTHIGLVSDRRGARGPLIVHNIGAGTREEDALLDWPITGRYRWALG